MKDDEAQAKKIQSRKHEFEKVAYENICKRHKVPDPNLIHIVFPNRKHSLAKNSVKQKIRKSISRSRSAMDD